MEAEDYKADDDNVHPPPWGHPRKSHDWDTVKSGYWITFLRLLAARGTERQVSTMVQDLRTIGHLWSAKVG